MSDKRTPDQLEFDGILHGIAFAHFEAQLVKLSRATIVARRLPNDKKRQERLAFWRKELGE